MGYQIGLILVIIVVAILILKKMSKKNDETDQLIFEDEMSKDELEDIDKELE